MSVNMALVRFIYPRRMMGRGIANASMIVAIASATGPTLAALILSFASWKWLFLINVPLGAAALLLARHRLPTTPVSSAPFDVAGVVFNIVTLSLVVCGISFLGDPATYPRAGLCILGGVGFGVLFVLQQRSKPAPILPLDLLGQPQFAFSVATSICAFVTQSIAFITIPFLLEGVFARSNFSTGLLISGWPIAIALVARLAGPLSDRFAPGAIGAAGLACLSLGLLALGVVGAGAGNLDIAWRIVLCGIGFGLFQPSNNKAMMESAPPNRSGGAAGMQSTARLLGQSLGAAAMSVMLATIGRQHLQTPLLVAAATAALGAMTSATRRGRSHRTLSI